MSDITGHSDAVGRVIDYGTPLIKLEKKVETVANIYPGRLAALGTTDQMIKVCDGVNAPPIGWVLHNETSPEYQQDSMLTIYEVNDYIKIGRGGSFSIWAWMPKGFVARQGDEMFSFTDGYVAPGAMINGMPALAFSFTKNTGETDTGVDLAAGMVVVDVFVLTETAVAGSSIDIGILSSEGGGNTDGFADGITCITTGLSSGFITYTVATNTYIAAATDVTWGAFLATVYVGTNAAVDEDGSVNRLRYKCDGTAKSVVYLTSSHTIAGRFFLAFSNLGIQKVGYAEESVDAVAAEKRIWVRNTL